MCYCEKMCCLLKALAELRFNVLSFLDNFWDMLLISTEINFDIFCVKKQAKVLFRIMHLQDNGINCITVDAPFCLRVEKKDSCDLIS